MHSSFSGSVYQPQEISDQAKVLQPNLGFRAWPVYSPWADPPFLFEDKLSAHG